MKLAIASLSLLLVACNPQPPASEPSPQAEIPAPASPVATDAEVPMAKRGPGQENAGQLLIFRAFGTEPFWNVNVEDSTLTYTTPEDQVGVVMQGTRGAIDGGVQITGSHDGKAFVLAVTDGTCSDGMSDNQYTLAATFRYGDLDYKGCGEVAK